MPVFRNLIGCIALAALWPTWALEPDKLYAKIAPSIVVVAGFSGADTTDFSFGSGVVIAPGQIVTNCHVIEDANLIYLKRADFFTSAVLRFADAERDLCQVSADEKAGFDQPISGVVSLSELRVGQRVYALGSPQGLELTLSDGLISSLRQLKIGTVIQTNAPMSHGSSGGGLFDAGGRLIGITSFQAGEGQNLNFAVPASWILELPSRHVEREAQAQLRREEEARHVEEQERLEEERRAEEIRHEEERREHAAAVEHERQRQEAQRKQREADEATRRAAVAVPATPVAPETQEKLLDEWKARIQAKIRGRVVVPANIQGNPEARFDVVLLPGGEVLSATLRKSSGVAAYDAAVKRAIMLAQPLPVPADPDLFHTYFREIALRFTPYEGALRVEDISPTPLPTDSHVEPHQLLTYGQSISKEIKRYQKYPPLAQRRGWEGTAEVHLQIAADGNVTSVTLGKSSGRSVLDEEALNMVRRASPLPQAPQNLRGRELTVTVPVVFSLQESEPPPQ
jgi:TonB family protein